MEAYLKECQGFEDRDAVRVVSEGQRSSRLQLVLTTRSNKVYFRNEKYVDLHAGISKLMESMTHILQTEVRLMTAIAAENRCNIYKTDAKQAFLCSDLENDEPIYISPPDW